MLQQWSYKNKISSDSFLHYAQSTNGKQEQAILEKFILPLLPSNKNAKILDAACGNGWLSEIIFQNGYTVSACDISPDFIQSLRKNNPQIPAEEVDLCQKLPYLENHFDCVVVNMSFHDFENPDAVFQSIYSIISPGGKLIITIANPYYSYPIGKWKRSFWQKILNRKPSLLLSPYNFFTKKDRLHLWHKSVPSYFRTLPEYIQGAIASGFSLEKFQEISSENDSRNFDRTYQLHRFPMILLLVFRK